MNRKRLLIIVPLFVIGVAIFALLRSSRSATTVPNEAAGNGTIEATEVGVSAKISGRVVELKVKEGNKVKEGDVIAVLAHRELDAQVEQAKGTLSAAQARLQQMLVGTREEQIRAARATLAQAEANRQGAAKAVANTREIYRKSTELKQQVDAAAAQVASTTAAYEGAQARLAQLRNGARPQELEQAKAALTAAESSVAGAQKTLANAREIYDQRTQAKQQVDQAEMQVEVAKANVAQLTAVRDNAQTEMKRMEALYSEGAVPQQQLDNARTQFKTAQESLDAAKASLVGAQKTLANMREMYRKSTELKQQVDTAETQLQVALQQRKQAQEALSLLREGARPEEIAQAEAAVQQARANVEGAKRSLENARQLYADRLTAKQQADTAQMQYNVAQGQVAAAHAQLDMLLRGETKEAIDSARGQVEQAKGALQLALAQQENAVIVAPRSGVITEVVAEEGETVTPGMPIVNLIDLERPYVKVYLPLPQLGKVKLGQTARVTTDAYPGRTYKGVVTEISDVPEFTPKNVQTPEQRVTLVFYVKVSVDNPKGELKPGLPADAVIRT
jgi:multidrug resistance efflux pump